MATLHLRGVPEEVIERLAMLAMREGMAVSAFAVRELTALVERVPGGSQLSKSPDQFVAAEAVVADVEAGRADR